MTSEKRFFLIDFENVQPSITNMTLKEADRILVFVGANQKNISIDTASILQKMGERVQYIKIKSSGKNALDFCIAYYIGKLSCGYSGYDFQILSKDTGYDPLIAHLKEQGIKCKRITPTEKNVKKIDENTKSNKNDSRVKLIEDALDKKIKTIPPSVPNSTKALSALINSHFQNTLPNNEIMQIFSGLIKKKIISINGREVIYTNKDI